MDDHDYDGARRSSDFDQPIDPSGYTLEAFVPASEEASGAGNSSPAEQPRFQPKLVNLRQSAEPAPRFKKNFKKQLPQIVGSSTQTKHVRELISLYAEDDSPVIITGETGVGKELVARHLHALSPRHGSAFSPINAGGMPESLAAAELFGHAKGAYTGAVGERDGAIAMANGGVLFLDEIGDMPLSIQAHLLRVLEDGMVMKLGGKSPTQVDFRLISATHVD
ncbi:MAG: sigma-54 factor interaction domain-containing protein, partial [Pseudomonadota bacterium]